MNCNPPFTSPMAHTCGLVVCKRSFTLTAPRSSVSTTAASRFSPSVKGRRPVANNMASASRWKGSPLTASRTAISFPDILCTLAFIRKVIPFFSSTSFTMSATSRSSRGIKSACPSSTVTCEPKEAYIEANSSPTYPPPIIASFSGSSFSSMIEVLVKTCGLPLIPSMGGMMLSAPVLMKMRGACNDSFSRPERLTSTLSGLVKLPVPVYTVMFG